MRIVVITDRYAPEARAAAYLSQQISEELVQRGHQVTVLTKRPGEFLPDGAVARLERKETLNGVLVRRSGFHVSCQSSFWLRAAGQFLTALMLGIDLVFAEKPDVIMVYSPPLPVVISALIHRLLRNIPYVLNLHDLYPSTAVELGVLKNPLMMRVALHLESVAYRYASQIIVAAPRSRSLVANVSGSPSKIHFVPNCVNMSECLPGSNQNRFCEPEKLSNSFVVLYAGLMGIAQDLETVLSCARRMLSQKNVIFLLMGDGKNARKWQALAHDLPNVHFHRPVANREYMEALRSADVCLVTLSPKLHAPAIPGKISTIMAVGKPLIAVVPPWSDTIPLIQESKCGLVATSGRPEELQAAIETVINNPGLAAELGANGFTYAQQHLSLKAVVPLVERVLLLTQRSVFAKTPVSDRGGDKSLLGAERASIVDGKL